MERLRRALRGVDRAEAPALPVGEAMHPVALAAVVVLLVNDWLLKGIWPGVVTGKLSDVAGLTFAPVVLSSALGLVLLVASRLGARLDPSLTRRRLIGCVAATAAGFAIVKLSPTASQGAAALLGHLGRNAVIYLDRSDLLCLPALGVAWWIGKDELRRVPLGKPAAIRRLGGHASPALEDCRWAGGDHKQLAALADAIDTWDPARIDALLAPPR